MLGIGKIFGSKKPKYFLEFGDGKGTEAPKTEAKPAPAPAPAPKDIPQAAVAKPEAPKPTTVKAKPEAKSEAKPEAKPEVKPEPAKEPVPINNGVVKTPAGMTFAPDNLMPLPTGSRRRPGQNMAMFKEMARQMNR